MKNKEGAFVKVPSSHRNDFRDREVSQFSFQSCRARTPLTVANARRRVDQGVCFSPTRPSLYPPNPCLGWYQRSFALKKSLVRGISILEHPFRDEPAR